MQLQWRAVFPRRYFSPSTLNNSMIEEAMTGVFAEHFGEDGLPKQVISMQSWYHYKGETITQMMEPCLKVYHPDGSWWDISAHRGQGYQNSIAGKLAKIHLTHGVVVKQSGKNQGDWWNLKTQNLLVFPDKQLAQTPDPVVVNSPGIDIQAVGIRAHLDNHTVEFLHAVKTQYANTQ
ncbi:MAG: LPS export ABC transporter periplasmic protein LptC [Candidatus Berkiellales bacterium]